MEYYAPRVADDVTDELVEAAHSVADGWYQGQRIDWPDVFDRVDGITLDDGRRVDLGDSLTSPALAELKRRVRKRLAEG